MLGPSKPGNPPRLGRLALTPGIAPDWPPLDCASAVAVDEPSPPLAPEGILALDCAPPSELDDELDCEDGIDGCCDGGCEEDGGADAEGIEGIEGEEEDCDEDGMLGELEGLLGEGIDADDEDELWLCD